jgi:hypothetical protein
MCAGVPRLGLVGALSPRPPQRLLLLLLLATATCGWVEADSGNSDISNSGGGSSQLSWQELSPSYAAACASAVPPGVACVHDYAAVACGQGDVAYLDVFDPAADTLTNVVRAHDALRVAAGGSPGSGMPSRA